MPAPLSLDLRSRVVDAYESGKDSLAVVAVAFRIGVATLVRLLALKRTTGSLEPRPHRGGQRSKLSEGDLGALRVLVREEPDATLEELAEALEKQVHKGVHPMMVSRALERIGYSRKKNSTPHRAGLATSAGGSGRVQG